MDDKSLVEDIVGDSVQLELALQTGADPIPLSMVVARDYSSDDEWSLLVAIPPELSRLKAYERIQNELDRLSLDLQLDRIVLVKSSDRGFRELVHSSALSTGRSSGWNGTPVEVAGRAYGDPIRVRLDPQQFERDVLNALREGFSTETTSFFLNNQGRADDIFWRGGQRAFEFDAQLWLRNTVVLIDIKVNQRPLTFSQILSAFGRLSLMQRATDERVVMALIASGGFSDRAQSTLSLAPDFALISWQPSYGNERLVQAIEMLVSSRATDS